MLNKKNTNNATNNSSVPYVLSSLDDSVSHKGNRMDVQEHGKLFLEDNFDEEIAEKSESNTDMVILSELPEAEPRNNNSTEKQSGIGLTPETEKKEKNKHKKPKSNAAFAVELTLKLLVICAATAGLLAFVNSLTAPIIAKNELAKKELALSAIFPELTGYETVDASLTEADELYTVSNGNSTVGYCAVTSPSGFGGKLSMMVGVDADRNIRGIQIISHSETAGVGTKALDASYLSGYTGIGGESIVLGSDIDAFAHATVTSKAVNSGVNSALSVYDTVFSNEAQKNTDPETAISGMYGWVDNVKWTQTEYETPFDNVYFVSADNVNAGYAAVVTVFSSDGSAKLLIGTWAWPEQILGVRVLEAEGKAFEELKSDTEYLSSFRGKSAISEATDDPAKEAVNTAAAEVFNFYSEYKKLASRTAFTDAELNTMMLDSVKAQYGWVTNSIFSRGSESDDFDMIYEVKADGVDAGICAMVTIEADDGFAIISVGTWAWPEKQILSVTLLHSDSESIDAFFADPNNPAAFSKKTEAADIRDDELNEAESVITDAVNRVLEYYKNPSNQVETD